jgi:hypothetical protein
MRVMRPQRGPKDGLCRVNVSHDEVFEDEGHEVMVPNTASIGLMCRMMRSFSLCQSRIGLKPRVDHTFIILNNR